MLDQEFVVWSVLSLEMMVKARCISSIVRKEKAQHPFPEA